MIAIANNHQESRAAQKADEGLGTSDRTELATRDPLGIYMRETKRFPLLSAEEEHELAVRLVEEDDASAARRLIESNLRLVVKIAYEYKRAHQSLLDMVQEGNVGLMQAVSKFDPYRGVKLSSYASWWIRAFILKYILNNHRLVKVGTTQAQRKLFFNLKKEKDRLESQGFNADAATIAKSLDVREKDVVEMQKRLGAPDASFDAPLKGDDDGSLRTRHDVMESANGNRPDEAVEESQFQSLLKEKLGTFADTLEGREKSPEGTARDWRSVWREPRARPANREATTRQGSGLPAARARDSRLCRPQRASGGLVRGPCL